MSIYTLAFVCITPILMQSVWMYGSHSDVYTVTLCIVMYCFYDVHVYRIIHSASRQLLQQASRETDIYTSKCSANIRKKCRVYSRMTHCLNRCSTCAEPGALRRKYGQKISNDRWCYMGGPSMVHMCSEG